MAFQPLSDMQDSAATPTAAPSFVPLTDMQPTAQPRGGFVPLAQMTPPQQPAVRPFPHGAGAYDVYRDVARGILSVPGDFAGLLGHVTGSDTLQHAGTRSRELLNEYVAPEATFADDPVRAAIQFAAPALVPLPGVGFTRAGQAVTGLFGATGRVGQAVGAGLGRAIELASPGTSGYTLGNVAANALLGAGIGAGSEGVQRQALAEAATPEGAQGGPWQTAASALPYAALTLGGVSAGAAALGAARAFRNRGLAPQDLANVGALSQPGAPHVPRQGPGVIEQIEAGTFNRDIVALNRLNQLERDGIITPQQARETSALVHLQTKESINNDVAAETLRTGIFDNGRRMPESPAALMDELAGRLTEAQRTTLNNLAAAADELQVRQNNATAGRFHQNNPAAGGVRSALMDQDDATLGNIVRSASTDPTIAAVMDRYHAINNSLLSYAVDKGAISIGEAQKMRNSNPYYVHRIFADMEQKGNNPLRARDSTEGGGPERYQDMFAALQDGVMRTISYVRRNEAIREVANTLGNTGAHGVGDNIPATPAAIKRAEARGFTPILYRDGAQQMMVELDPSIATAVKHAPRAFIPFLNGARVVAQNLTTGPLGAALGNVQAFVSNITGALTAATNVPSQFRVGYLDAMLRRYTGLNMRQVMVDPTFAATVIAEAAAGWAAESARIFSTSMQRSLARNGTAVQVLGPQLVNDMMHRAAQYYESSLLHMARREGLAAQGIAHSANEYGHTVALTAVSPDYAVGVPRAVPQLSLRDIGSMEQMREHLARWSARGVSPRLRTVWQNYARLLDVTANAPQLAIYRQNRGHVPANQRNALLAAARVPIGDPAQHGGSVLTQRATSAAPYLNITMQSAHQTFASFKREPIATSMRIASLATMTSMTMLVSAILADEEAIENGEQPTAVAHMMTRSNRDAASAFRIYLPGMDPEDSIRIPVDGVLAPVFSAVLGALEEGMGVTDPRFYTGQYAPLREGIKEFAEANRSTRLQASFGRMGLDIPMSPAVQAGSALFGVDTRDALSLATGPEMRQMRDADGFATTRLSRDPVNKHIATVLETGFGFGGQAFADLARTFGYTASPRAVASQWVHGMTGSSRIAPFLTGVERKMGATDAVGEHVYKTERVLQNIYNNMSEVRFGPGSLGTSREPRMSPYGAGREGVPEDMRPMLATLGRVYTAMDDLRKERRTAQQNSRDAMASPTLRAAPERLRAEQNRLAREVRSVNNRIYGLIQRVEEQLSTQYGRRIRLDQLDPQQGMDQFPPMQ